MDTDPGMAVSDFKNEVAAKGNLELTNMTLMYGGKILHSGTLQDYGIQNNSTLDVYIKILGGMDLRKGFSLNDDDFIKW